MDRKEYFQKIRGIPWEDVLVKFGWRLHKVPYCLGIMKCVLHKDKTASLAFRESGFFICYGCGQDGDIFKFVHKVLRSYGNFGRTYRFFKKEFGIEPPSKEQF
ncbi:MAG: CHC2 zinc finger domain-containing protein [Candidatus Berkelbacteria bacterium]